MKILFIHQNFPGQFKHLAPAMAALGHEVVGLGVNKPAHPTPGVRVLLHHPKVPDAGTAQGILPEMQDFHAKTIRGQSVARVLAKLQKEGFIPDLICAHSGWGEAYFIKDVFPHTPLLVYAEYYYGGEDGDAYFDPEFNKPTLQGLERLRLKNSHLLHALAAADRGLSPTIFQRKRHPPLLRDKIEVIHDGIDTTRFAPNPQAFVTLQQAGITLRPEDEVVTYVARELEPYRGYHQFMRCLPRLLAARPKAQVIIVGGSGVSYGAAAPAGKTWKDIFHQEVAGRIDPQRVHFVGKVPHETLTLLMQVSTAHVYLTYPFVLSWSLMEAMSVGCLIVGSRTAPLEELIRHEENGLLVDFFKPDEIANTIAMALEKRESLNALREAARQTIVDNYDLNAICLPRQIALLESMMQVARQG